MASKVKVKQIREKALKIQNGWNEGAAATTKFGKVAKADYDAAIAEGKAADDDVDDLRARLTIAEDTRDDKYVIVKGMNVDVRAGVAGHEDYGDDHPVYEAMSFVRKSEKASGLTRKKKDGGDGNQ